MFLRKNTLDCLAFIHRSVTFALANLMVGIAQLVRVSDCGPEGRGFDPHFPPKERQKAIPFRCGFFIVWK